jgi:subtilase family serine protease
VYSADDMNLVGGSGFAMTLNTGDSFRYPIIKIPATTPSGTYFVLFKIDPENKIAETDETNNLQALAITITGGPMADLALQAAASNPDAAPAGGKVTLAAALANTGKAPARASTLRYYLSADATLDSTDVVLGNAAATAIAVSDTLATIAELSLPANTAVGNYYILFVADADSTVTEDNEDNNIAAVAFIVTAPLLPDLSITMAAPVAVSALPGATITATAMVKNQGSAAVSAGNISYYLSANNTYEAVDVLTGNSAGTTLAAGAEAQLSVTLTIPAETAPGQYYLLAIADPAGSITESDETNNVYAFAFAVAAPAPDLTLQSPALSAVTVARGAALTATATLANVGTGPALAGKLQYYLSANDSLESGDVLLGESEAAALAAGDSSALSVGLIIPAATATGDYFVLLVADATGLNAESNEANNLVRVTLTVSVASGIQDLQAGFAVKLAPNPAPEQVTITADNLPRGVKVAELSFYNNTGNKVLQTSRPLQGHALRTKLDVGHLSQGTYLLHIRLGEEVVVRKIVIAR